MAYHAPENMRAHISRHQPSNFELHKNVQGVVTSERAFVTAQDFWNGFAAFWGFVIPWGLIGYAAYLAFNYYIG